MAKRWRRTTCDALFGSSGPFVFCTFALFLFGDEVTPSAGSSSDAELMEQGHQIHSTPPRACAALLVSTQTADGRRQISRPKAASDFGLRKAAAESVVKIIMPIR